MSIDNDFSILGDAIATHAEISGDNLIVTLSDGRRISTPLAWYEWLQDVPPEQRANISVLGDAIEWPDLDQGVDVEWMLRGAR